jgi:hypothetical protein
MKKWYLIYNRNTGKFLGKYFCSIWNENLLYILA